jgi:Ca2+-binding RTX toxin-like protein
VLTTASWASDHAEIGTDKQDFIDGKAGNDVIYGRGGVDVINAGGGNDVIAGGKDKDWISGQAGRDVFRFTSLRDSTVGKERDVINDFGFGHDRIDLRQIDANTSRSGNQAFHLIGNSAFTGSPGDLRTYFDGHDTIVRADVNGDKVADMEIALGGRHILTAAEFML